MGMNRPVFWVIPTLLLLFAVTAFADGFGVMEAFQQGKDAAAGGNTANSRINSNDASSNVPGYNGNPKEAGFYGDGKKDLSGDGLGKQAGCVKADTLGFNGKECDAINFLGDSRPGYPLSRNDSLFNLSDSITKDNREGLAGLGGGDETGGCVKVLVKNPDLKTVEHCEEWLQTESKRCSIGRVVKVDKDVNYQCEVTTAQKVSHECHKKLTVTCQAPADGCDANGVVLGGTSGDMKWDVSKSGGNLYMTFGTIANDYWGNGVYDRSGTFTINKMSDVSMFAIDHAWFDDWVWVKINNTTVYVGPKGGDRLDTDVYQQQCSDEFCWNLPINTGAALAANGYTKSGSSYTKQICTKDEFGFLQCSSDSWNSVWGYVFYTGGAWSLFELKTSWDISLAINIKPYLREGSNTIWVRTVVGGKGESAIRMVTRQFCPPTCTDSWVDGCAGYNR